MIDEAAHVEAEFNAYAAAVSRRIGEQIAEHVDPENFLKLSDDELHALAATAIAVILNEIGQDAIDSAIAFAKAAGYPEPTRDEIDAAIRSAVEGDMNRLYTALEERQAQAKKAAGDSESLSEGLLTGLTLALGVIFGNAAQAIVTNIANEINRETALSYAEAAGADPEEVTAGMDPAEAAAILAAAELGIPGIQEPGSAAGLGTWLTIMDGKQCDEESGTVTTPSGVKLPPGAATSCQGRHGVILPMTDWVSEGFPRDTRLLCSRYNAPRCRCRVLAGAMKLDTGPVDVSDDVKRGRARAAAEVLDFQAAHLDAAFASVSAELTPLLDPDLFEIAIRIKNRPLVTA